MAMKGMQAAARSAQEALGFEPPSHMKGLQVFIADIRNCPNKEQEEKRVDKELAKIRLKFTSSKTVSGYDKKKYVWKLLYAYMLGYEVDFGHFQAVELCSSNKFSEKTAGYLAISLLLADNAEILRLVVNSIKHDMMANQEQHAALALNTVANIGGSEFADNLFVDISKMLLQNNTLSAYIKRKACICLLRLYRKDNDTLQPDIWRRRLTQLFQDRDIGLLTSASGFILGILETAQHPIAEWRDLIPPVSGVLATLVQGECPEHYEYYHVPAPWLQTKLLRILQFYPVAMFGPELLQRVNIILNSILSKPTTQRAHMGGGSKKRPKADAERQNRSNAEHAVLFEAMNLMIELGDACDPDSLRTAAGLLGAFISSADPNIRYLGLETMARLAIMQSMHEHLERYKNLILEKMHESDVSIRRQALNLLYALCTPANWQHIVDELLEILSGSDALLQEELVLKIAILAERNAPNFGWYVDVVFRMLESAPDSVSDEVWYRVVQVVTGFEEGMSEADKNKLQSHAAGKAFQNLTAGGNKPLHETLVRLGAYLIGEFGHLLPQNIPPRAKFDSVHRHFARGSSQTKAIIMLACSKLLNANPDALKRDVISFLEDLQEEHDVDIQQRACEMLIMLRDEDFVDHVLFTMPSYAESVQQNNPLVQRLKFQSKSRAHTREQLEHAAKSEGGVLKSRGKPVRGSGEDSSRAGNSPGGFGGASPGGQGNAIAARGAPQESDSETSSESSDDGAAPGAAPAAAAAAGGGAGPRELWKQLCIMPQGPFYSSASLSLELKQEYNTSMGRLTIMFTNPGQSPIGNIRVMLPEVPFMRMQAMNEPPASLGPGQQAPHFVQVQCLRPFLQPAKYMVEYCDRPGGQPIQLPFMLPAVMTKFITPAEMPMAQFRPFFESLEGAPREHVTVGGAEVPPNQWPNYITKGFNFSLIEGSTPACAFGAGTFHTGTPDPSKPGAMMTVPCMLRLEYNEQAKMVRLTVRSQHGEVTQHLSQIMTTYLVTPTPSG